MVHLREGWGGKRGEGREGAGKGREGKGWGEGQEGEGMEEEWRKEMSWAKKDKRQRDRQRACVHMQGCVPMLGRRGTVQMGNVLPATPPKSGPSRPPFNSSNAQ